VNLRRRHSGLTHISRKFIEDLENIYIPPGSLDHFRPPEESTSPGNTSRPFFRTISDMSLGFLKGDIALYLSDNEITKLPKELFNLQKLAILSISTFIFSCHIRY
jgi:Leucine-rich repeat (LRR) protein